MHSWLGAGELQPISTEETLEAVGINAPYKDVQFGKFMGNNKLIEWYSILNEKYSVKGSAKIFFKMSGCDKTKLKPEQALK